MLQSQAARPKILKQRLRSDAIGIVEVPPLAEVRALVGIHLHARYSIDAQAMHR